MFSSFYFFFFQAEDGIRDDLVTGVQTCALPISSMRICRVPIAFLVLGWLLPLAAQTLDTGVLGTVLDPQGGTVGGASVTISNTAMGVSRVVKTTADGKYEVRYLVPGDYTIEVQAPGFRTERRTGV